MKSKLFFISSIILYTMSAVAVFLFLYIDFFNVNITKFDKIILSFSVFIFSYLASLLRCVKCDSDKAKSVMYSTLFFLFVFYIIVIIDFTLIDGSFGRNLSILVSLDKGARKLFLKYNTNIIPFYTLRLFLKALRYSTLKFSDVFDNIIGNLLILSPLAFFVRVFYKRINGFFKFMVFSVIFVVIIELLQILFVTGSADIDDLILNVTGAMVSYAVLNTKCVSRILKIVTFNVWEG